MNINDIHQIALRSVDEPWGMGHPELEHVDETWNPYYRFLYNVVATYKPEAVLECGIYKGVASGHMAAANPETLVIGIDNVPTMYANQILDSFPNIQYLTGYTTSAKMCKAVGEALGRKKIGLLFLDSEHDGNTPLTEFSFYRMFFADECLVVCDDIVAAYADQWQQDAMKAFWNVLPGEKLELHFLHDAYGGVKRPGFGVSIVRK